MENPWTGHLKRRPHMVNLTPKVVTYCKYGFPYMKKTALWTWNLDNWIPRPLCKKDCPVSNGKFHTECAQKGPSRAGGKVVGTSLTRNQLFAIPGDLVQEILECT